MVFGQGWKAHQTPVRPYYLWYVCNLYNLYVQAKFHPDTLDYLNYLLFFPKWSASQNLTDKLHRTQARPCATSPWLASPSTMGSKSITRNPTIFNIIPWVDGNIVPSIKCLMFQGLFYFIISFQIPFKNLFIFFSL